MWDARPGQTEAYAEAHQLEVMCQTFRGHESKIVKRGFVELGIVLLRFVQYAGSVVDRS